MLFLAYDKLIWRDKIILMESAARSDEIANAMLPSVVRDGIVCRSRPPAHSSEKYRRSSRLRDNTFPPKVTSLASTRGFRHHGASTVETHADEPIAEHFSDCSIMFADIVGVTDRDQVLLECLNSAFDE